MCYPSCKFCSDDNPISSIPNEIMQLPDLTICGVSILIGTPGPTVEPTPRPTLGSISIGSSEIDLNTTGLDLREFQKLDCGISQSVSDLTCVNAILLAKLI